jgi:hypothetical protein
MHKSKSYRKIVLEEEMKHRCCDGHVYYDGRCGDGPIYIHEEGCPVGRREKREEEYWSMDRR